MFEAMAESKRDVELIYTEGKEQGVCVRWHKPQTRELVWDFFFFFVRKSKPDTLKSGVCPWCLFD